MGAWPFVEELLTELASELRMQHAQPRYAGRMTAASPATGNAKVHAAQQQQLVAEALEVGRAHVGRLAARRALTDG